MDWQGLRWIDLMALKPELFILQFSFFSSGATIEGLVHLSHKLVDSFLVLDPKTNNYEQVVLVGWLIV